MVMGARIIHLSMLDKLYLEAASWPHALVLNNKRVWYLLRTAEEGEVGDENCYLLGRGTRLNG